MESAHKAGIALLMMAWAVVASLPISAAGTAGPLGADSTELVIARLDNGDGPQDDCFYLQPYGFDSTVDQAIRLTSCGATLPAGSLVYGSSSDVGKNLRRAPVGLAFADLNGDGAYGAGDAVYAVTSPPPPKSGPTASAYAIRLTPFGAMPAGAVVAAGDADADVATALVPLDGSFGFVDNHAGDARAHDDGVDTYNGTYEYYDFAFVLAGHAPGMPAGSPLPAFAIDLQQNGPFGSQTGVPSDDSATAATTSTGAPVDSPAESSPAASDAPDADSDPPSSQPANQTHANATASAPAAPPANDSAADASPAQATGSSAPVDDTNTNLTWNQADPALAAGGAGQAPAGGGATDPPTEPSPATTPWWNRPVTIPAGFGAPAVAVVVALALAARRR